MDSKKIIQISATMQPGNPLPEDSTPHQPSAGSKSLTINDASAYLKKVEEVLKDSPEKYGEFLEVMKAFHARRIDNAGVAIRIKNLLKDHQSLLPGFNIFLPEGYEIIFPSEKDSSGEEISMLTKAINHVKKVKMRFQNDETVYENFLEILKMYRVGIRTVHEVYGEVEILFHNCKDLLEEFEELILLSVVVQSVGPGPGPGPGPG